MRRRTPDCLSTSAQSAAKHYIHVKQNLLVFPIKLNTMTGLTCDKCIRACVGGEGLLSVAAEQFLKAVSSRLSMSDKHALPDGPPPEVHHACAVNPKEAVAPRGRQRGRANGRRRAGWELRTSDRDFPCRLHPAWQRYREHVRMRAQCCSEEAAPCTGSNRYGRHLQHEQDPLAWLCNVH